MEIVAEVKSNDGIIFEERRIRDWMIFRVRENAEAFLDYIRFKNIVLHGGNRSWSITSILLSTIQLDFVR